MRKPAPFAARRSGTIDEDEHPTSATPGPNFLGRSRKFTGQAETLGAFSANALSRYHRTHQMPSVQGRLLTNRVLQAE